MLTNLQLVPSPQFASTTGGKFPFGKFLSDTANLKTNIISAFTMNSTSYGLTQGTAQAIKFPHGLGATPGFVRATLLCVTADGGSSMSPGQEVGIEACFAMDTNSMVFGVAADSTYIYATYLGTWCNQCEITLFNGPGSPGIGLPTSLNNFALKIYWQS